jgi:hypothetical protein
VTAILGVTPDAIDCHQEAANMPYMTADALVERMKGIPEFILSKIAEILDCYDKETTVAEGFLFECCPKCRAIPPEVYILFLPGHQAWNVRLMEATARWSRPTRTTTGSIISTTSTAFMA